MKLIDKVKPEILNYLKSSVKPKYSVSYRSIVSAFKSKECYRNLTIDEVDLIQLHLDDRFRPKTRSEFLFGDYLLTNKNKF